MSKRNKKNEAFFRSALMNTWDFTQYEDMLTEIALSRFEWKGLPDTCDERYLERALFYNGKAIYMNDEVLGDLTLKVALNGNFDVYGVPRDRTAYGQNEYRKKCSPEDSVVVWNNYNRKPTFPMIRNYAMRLYDLDRTIDVNTRAQKTPVLVQCNQNDRLTLENLYADFDGNKPVIYGKKGFDLSDAFQVIRTDAPFVSPQIFEMKRDMFNECLTMLGIANLNMEKKERMVSAEVTKSAGGTVAQRYAYLVMRQKACEQINKMFGTNISVDFRGWDVDNQVDREDAELGDFEMSGGGDNE